MQHLYLLISNITPFTCLARLRERGLGSRDNGFDFHMQELVRFYADYRIK